MNKQLLALALLVSASCTMQAGYSRQEVVGSNGPAGQVVETRGGYRRGVCGTCHQPRQHCCCKPVREKVCTPKMKCCPAPREKVCQPKMKCCKVPRERICEPKMKCCKVPCEKVCTPKMKCCPAPREKVCVEKVHCKTPCHTGCAVPAERRYARPVAPAYEHAEHAVAPVAPAA